MGCFLELGRCGLSSRRTSNEGAGWISKTGSAVDGTAFAALICWSCPKENFLIKFKSYISHAMLLEVMQLRCTSEIVKELQLTLLKT